MTHTQLPRYYNYRTDSELTSEKINSPSLLLLVPINSIVATWGAKARRTAAEIKPGTLFRSLYASKPRR